MLVVVSLTVAVVVKEDTTVNSLQGFVYSLMQDQPPASLQSLAIMGPGPLFFLSGVALLHPDKNFVPRRHSPTHGISAFKAEQEAWAPETGPPKVSP